MPKKNDPTTGDSDLLKGIEARQAAWADRNFGGNDDPRQALTTVGGFKALLGLASALGRLSHAHLKQDQGIRGTAEEHQHEARLALLDLKHGAVVYGTVRAPLARPETHAGPGVKPALGLIEEVGELCLALAERELAIRSGDQDAIDAANLKLRDAAGDVGVYLIDFCRRNGWAFSDVLEETWAHVEGRDWVKNKADGTTPAPGADAA